MPETKNRVAVTLDGISCIIPDAEISARLLARGVSNVNGFSFRPGKEWGRGNVLLTKSDLDTLNRTGLDLVITEGSTSVTIENLLIVDSYSLFSPTTNNNSVYLVDLADPRFILAVTKLGVESEHFPPQELIAADGGATFQATWEDALDEYWTESGASQTLSHTNADYPVVLLRDVETKNTDGAFDTFNNVLALASHALFFDGTNFKSEALSYPNTTNTTLAADNTSRLISSPVDLSDFESKLPGTLRVKYRKIDRDIFNQQLSFDETYAGSLTPGNFTKALNVYNIHNPDWDADLNNGNQATNLETLAGELATLYFDAFDNTDSIDGVYFGVIPFEHSANVAYLDYGHNVTGNVYLTRAVSYDMGKHEFPCFDRMGELLSEMYLDKTIVKLVRPLADVSPGNSVSCAVYAGPLASATGEILDVVWLDWMADEQISEGKDAVAMYDGEAWHFIGAACEEDDPAASSIGIYADETAAGDAEDSPYGLIFTEDDYTLKRNGGGSGWLSAPPP